MKSEKAKNIGNMKKILIFVNMQEGVNPTTFEEVKKIIKRLKKKSSTGLDGLSPKLLQYLTDNIIHCYVHIFNLSLSQGKFISAFKKAKVI